MFRMISYEGRHPAEPARRKREVNGFEDKLLNCLFAKSRTEFLMKEGRHLIKVYGAWEREGGGTCDMCFA